MPKTINLFAGPGGMCWAAEMLGVPSVGIERDLNAVATRMAAGLATRHGDVRNYGPADFPDCDVLAAGPPCQTFTLTGNGTGRADLANVLLAARWMSLGLDVTGPLADLSDERTGLVLEPLRWILEAHRAGRPYRTIVLEQVPAVMPVWCVYADILGDLGYSTSVGFLLAERYGVPQTRKRAVLIASLDREVRMPVPFALQFFKGALENNCPGMHSVIDRGEPFTMVSNYGTGGDASKRGRRDFSEPSFTVTGKINRNRLISHSGRELDRLTPAEAGALQGFPVGYPWRGRDVWQQIGNAAPVTLMTHVFRAALGL